MTGQIVDIYKSRITLEITYDDLERLEKLKGVELDIDIKKKRKKRSLNANAYFHVLVGKIAAALNISDIEAKNNMLNLYGTLEQDDDGKVQHIIMSDNIPWNKIEYLHLRPTTRTKILDNDKVYRVYMIVRGSHTYDTKEMSRLIEGTIGEAKELGIETITPDEKLKMMEAWENAKR